jgi:hypothetical protein
MQLQLLHNYSVADQVSAPMWERQNCLAVANLDRSEGFRLHLELNHCAEMIVSAGSNEKNKRL